MTISTEVTIENSVLMFIDHQPAIMMVCPSLRPEILVNNVAGLAASAKALGVPTVLTTVGAKGSILADPIIKELSEIFPDVTPIDRTTTHAWADPRVSAAVKATGRKTLIMAGVATEVCLAQSVFSALKEGYDVFFVSDCSSGVTQEAHDDAKSRMIMAGAKPVNWLAVISEWTPDINSRERAALGAALGRRAGTSSLWFEYVFAQIEGGVVPAPTAAAA